MLHRKLYNSIAIILTFLSLTFNLKSQISDSFLLIYESYGKLDQIETVIQNAEDRILKKYGVNPEMIINKQLKINPTEYFVGYQIKNFNGQRLIELKFNKNSLEDFFNENSIPFFSFQGDVKVFISASNSFFESSDIFVLDNSLFQSELANAQLLSNLNQNIEIRYEFIDDFPSTEFALEQVMEKLIKEEKDDWILVLIDRFDLNNWSFNFPKSKNIFFNNSLEFRDFILSEAINEASQEKSLNLEKRTYFATFNADLTIEEIEIILNKLSESTDVLNFRVKTYSQDGILLEYESYLNEESVLNLMKYIGENSNE
mgnify:CR=1 FL=1